MKKRLLMILIGLGSLILLTSCGGSAPKEEKEKLPTKTPSEVAQLYIDALMGKGDAPLVEYNSLLGNFVEKVEEYKQTTAEMMITGLAEKGVTPENVNLMKESILGRNNTTDITIVSEDIQGNTATVTLSVRGVNLNGMDTSLNERITNELNAGVLDYNLDDAGIMNVVTAYMSEYMKTAPLFDEGTSVVLTFKLVDGLWIMNILEYKDIVDLFVNMPETT